MPRSDSLEVEIIPKMEILLKIDNSPDIMPDNN